MQDSCFHLIVPGQKLGLGIRGKFKRLLGELHPLIQPLVQFPQFILNVRFLFGQNGLLFLKLLITDKVPLGIIGRNVQLYQVFYFGNTVIQGLLLILDENIAIAGFQRILTVECLQCKVQITLRNGNGVQFPDDLLVQIFKGDRLLRAFHAEFPFGALVIHIGFERTLGLYKLYSFLGGNRAPAFRTSDHAPIREIFVPRLRFSSLPKEFLHIVKFFLSHHWSVLSLVYRPRILKFSIIERIGENLIPVFFPELDFSALGCRSQPPLIIGNIHDLRHGILARKHQIPHLPHQRKPFFVNQYLFASLVAIPIVFVPDGSFPGSPPLLGLGDKPATHILTQIKHELIGHAQFHTHHHDIVARLVFPPGCLNGFQRALLQEPLYFPTIDGISRESIDFPTNNPLRLSLLDFREHLAELHSSGSLGRLVFLKRSDDAQPKLSRQFLELVLLIFDGLNLPIFSIR